MNIREFALVAFSILAQMSIGAFIVLGVVHYFVKRKAGIEQADVMSDRTLWAIVITPCMGWNGSSPYSVLKIANFG